jgi:hypothetical protein
MATFEGNLLLRVGEAVPPGLSSSPYKNILQFLFQVLHEHEKHELSSTFPKWSISEEQSNEINKAAQEVFSGLASFRAVSQEVESLYKPEVNSRGHKLKNPRPVYAVRLPLPGCLVLQHLLICPPFCTYR